MDRDKLSWEKNAFDREMDHKESSFDREMSFNEEDAKIKNHLASRGLDLDEIRANTAQWSAESDADYRLRQEKAGLNEQQASVNTNKAIGSILGAKSIEEGFSMLESMTDSWASSGVDFRDVINALESKFPGSKAAIEGSEDYDMP